MVWEGTEEFLWWLREMAIRQFGICFNALGGEWEEIFIAQVCDSFRLVVLPTADILENWALLPAHSQNYCQLTEIIKLNSICLLLLLSFGTFSNKYLDSTSCVQHYETLAEMQIQTKNLLPVPQWLPVLEKRNSLFRRSPLAKGHYSCNLLYPKHSKANNAK